MLWNCTYCFRTTLILLQLLMNKLITVFVARSITKFINMSSGIARVIVLGGQVASGEGIQGGPPPPASTRI